MRDALLHLFARIAWHRPYAVLIAAIALAAISAWYAATSLTLNANTDDLVGRDRPFMQKYRAFLDEFGDLEYIFVVVERTGDEARTHAAVDAITARLRTIPDLPEVYSTIEPDDQLRLATRSMSEDELADLATSAEAFPALLTGDADLVLREAILRLQELVRTGARISEREQERLGASAVYLLNVMASANEGSPSQSELAFLLGKDQKREYFTSDTGRYYFINIMSEKDYGTLSVVEEPLRRIRAALDDLRSEFPDVNIGLTGKPVLQADEMATTNVDMTRAAILAFVLCAALFMISFGGFWKPLLAVIAFACGGAWTYGFATLTIGQLNLLSIVFMLVLIGVGMDYGVHLLARYREYRESDDVRSSIGAAILHAGRGNLTGALTSSIVFFMALLTSFQGLRELGLIAGAGLLLCVIAMTLVLPALLVISDRRRSSHVAARAAAATANPKSQIQNPKSLRSLRPAFVQVLSIDRFCEIDIEYVGQRREPGKDVREFLLQILAVRLASFAALVRADGVRQFADFLSEP